MARMTSGQIREALQVTAQFAPALLAAADIVAEVDAAEAKLALLNGTIAGKEQAIKELEAKRLDYEQQTLNVRNAFHTEVDRLEKQKNDLKVSILPIREEKEAAQADLEAFRKAAAEEIQGLLQQTKAEQDKLRKVKQLHDEFVAAAVRAG